MPVLKNAKHEAFTRAIVEGKSGGAAYRAAGYKAKARAADANASRLLKNIEVAARIAELKKEAAKGAVMTAQEVLEELSKIGRANMADYVRAFACGDPVAAVDQLTPEQTAALGEVTVEQFTDGAGDDAREVRRVKFKLIAKTTALDLLGKHHKLFPNRHEHSGPDHGPIKHEYENVTDIEASRIIGRLLNKVAAASPSKKGGGSP